MSIRDVINSLEGRELFCLPLAIPGEDTARTIYVSREVAEFVLWGTIEEDTREGDIAADSRALLDYCVEGGFLTVGENPFDKDADCIMARVNPAEGGLFDFRCLDPRPGARILGAFAEKDVFVALIWDYRDAFEDNWRAKVADCAQEWRRLFGNIPPVIGGLDECLSFGFRAV